MSLAQTDRYYSKTSDCPCLLITKTYIRLNRKGVGLLVANNAKIKFKTMKFQAFVTRKKSILELETEMLNGQKLQGPETAAEVEQTKLN